MVCSHNERDLNAAVENFFSYPPPEPKPSQVPTSSMPKGGHKPSDELKSVFKVYAGSNQSIDMDGIEKLCEDLGITSDDPIILYLAF